MTEDLATGYTASVQGVQLDGTNKNTVELMLKALSKVQVPKVLGCMALNVIAQLKLSDPDLDRMQNMWKSGEKCTAYSGVE